MSVEETVIPETHDAPADKRSHSDKPGSSLDSVFEEMQIDVHLRADLQQPPPYS